MTWGSERLGCFFLGIRIRRRHHPWRGSSIRIFSYPNAHRQDQARLGFWRKPFRHCGRKRIRS